jgi:hypothetical protein
MREARRSCPQPLRWWTSPQPESPVRLSALEPLFSCLAVFLDRRAKKTHDAWWSFFICVTSISFHKYHQIRRTILVWLNLACGGTISLSTPPRETRVFVPFSSLSFYYPPKLCSCVSIHLVASVSSKSRWFERSRMAHRNLCDFFHSASLVSIMQPVWFLKCGDILSNIFSFGETRAQATAVAQDGRHLLYLSI